MTRAMTPVGHVYTVDPGRPFLTALAEALLAGDLPRRGGRPPDALGLADITIYLPTRRPARALQQAFLAAAGGRALLLPRIKTPPAGAQLGAVGAQQVGEHDQRAIGHGHPRGVGQHPEAPGLDVMI